MGMDGHEWPYLVRGNTLPLAPGMTFSDEPGIYIRGEFGVRLEDDMVITETGAELFTPQSRAWRSRSGTRPADRDWRPRRAGHRHRPADAGDSPVRAAATGSPVRDRGFIRDVEACHENERHRTGRDRAVQDRQSRLGESTGETPQAAYLRTGLLEILVYDASGTLVMQTANKEGPGAASWTCAAPREATD